MLKQEPHHDNCFCLPGWRSLLFIPVHIGISRDEPPRGADTIFLDLEDSAYPLAEKGQRREGNRRRQQ